jgi:hypothetical protein
MYGSLVLISSSLMFMSAPSESLGKKKKKPTQIDVDVAVGGAGLMFPGVIQDDAQFHTSLRFNLQAIITQALIKKNKRRIPKKYRKLALKQKEIRFRPGVLALIPTNLVVSPQENTSIYGANWSLIGFGVAPSLGPLRLGVGAKLELSAFYLSSDLDLTQSSDQADAQSMMMATMNSVSDEGTSMFFLRPGLSLAGDLEIPLKKDAFAVSIGWKSTAYLPQDIGGGVGDMSFDNLDNSLWLMHQVYLDFHFRVPYSVRL